MMMPAFTQALSILFLVLVVHQPNFTAAFHVPEGSTTTTAAGMISRGGATEKGVLPPGSTSSHRFFKSRKPSTTTTLKLSSQQPAAGGGGDGDGGGDAITVIDRDFRVASIFLLGAVGFAQIPILKFVLAPVAGLLGVLFLVQTFRLQFVCDAQAFELLNTSKASGENILVGGQNRWTYNSFVNYEFFPKGWIDQPQGPILVYFKETQTPKDQWEKGPGAAANSEQAKEKGAVPGQAHFFPALCNTQQLRAEWEKRGCSKLE